MNWTTGEVREIGDFEYRWPEGPEEFDHGWETEVNADGETFQIRHGLGARDVFERHRRHSVTFVNGEPRVEGAAADDYEQSRSLISLLRKGDKTHARVGDELNEAYEDFDVVVHRQEIQAPRSANSLAVKIREDDVPRWATHAVLRHLGAVTAPQKPEPTRPPRKVHLLLRWRLSENPKTVDLHREVAQTRGSVWWGKLGDPKRSALSDLNLALIRSQVRSGVPTYVYLYRAGETWRASLMDISKDRSDVNPELIPEYYSEGPHHLWVQLTDFEQLDGDWPLQNLTLLADPVRGRLEQALKGQASLFLVTDLARRATEANPIQLHLERILRGYSQATAEPFNTSHPIWSDFLALKQELEQSEAMRQRSDLAVRASAGQGNWAKVPWIAVFDRRETQTIRDGVYVVYLFRQDSSGVYLTLNQGVTKPRTELGAAAAREMLTSKAAAIRDRFRSLADEGFALDDMVDLHAEPGLGSFYEDSTIAYQLYETGRVPADEVLLTDLEALLGAYETYVGSPPEVETPTGALPDQVTPIDDLGLIAETFSTALQQSHLTFGEHHERLVRSFIAALAAKRFVILTGLSGSGKTQIAMRFGEWVGENRYHLEPVRPDWTGAEALFGFEDALQPATADGRRVWFTPSVLRFMLSAARDLTRPYVLILDEMNLAHVERYFADVLSGMESGYPVLPNLQEEEDGQWRLAPNADARLPFPSNLFVVGTVNVDETTYMFSPKVLDRSNVFEFSVATNDLSTDYRKPLPCVPGPEGLVRGFLKVAIDPSWHIDHPADGLKEFQASLKGAHQVLSAGDYEFGHRVFFEATRFASALYATGEPDWRVALDRQVLQKLLPRLHGSRRRLEPTLNALGRFCLDLTVDPSSEAEPDFDPLATTEATPTLPESFDKIRRMSRKLRANQFVSFTE
jgi:5-methylcytosine-specific restriction protein B